jgi:hypothetical protein
MFFCIYLFQEDSEKSLSDINAPLGRDKFEQKHIEGSTPNGIVEHPKDTQALMKEPTLVFHQKLSLTSESRDEMVHETQPNHHEISPDHAQNNGELHRVQELQKADLRNEKLGGRSPGTEESDAFSFGPGRNNASLRQVQFVLFRVNNDHCSKVQLMSGITILPTFICNIKLICVDKPLDKDCPCMMQ